MMEEEEKKWKQHLWKASAPLLLIILPQELAQTIIQDLRPLRKMTDGIGNKSPYPQLNSFP